MHPHPFDRYAPFTDVSALKTASDKPLRKSLRVNTLKNSVDQIMPRLREKNWKLESVPWCAEAFYVEGAKAGELGRDYGHTLGHFYLQEAASMLPVTLLEPKPGDVVLDMAAAPGSKTTQIASALQSRGVVVANDVQERRIWILRSALERSGVTNCVMTKKVGHWFAKHMNERCDRVLCDAPCTAQGTLRKGTDALDYYSDHAVMKMSKLQRELLEAAVHACKVGGRIVYSTCTLTPEENEFVISTILHKFGDAVEAVSPDDIPGVPKNFFARAVEDSARVQEWMSVDHPELTKRFPAIRLWPHTYDTEGFFCAVLRKKASTLPFIKQPWIPFSEKPVSTKKHAEVTKYLQHRYGTTFLDDGEKLFERGERLYVLSPETSLFELPCPNYGVGLPFAKVLPDGRVIVTHELVSLRGMRATKNTLTINTQMLTDLLVGKDPQCDPALEGHILLRTASFCLGRGLAAKGKLKNNLPRGVISGVLD